MTEIKELKINVGPQHPSTHGVLRLVLTLYGEYIKSCEPKIGYLHRGLEKMAENRTYLQFLPLVDRLDYLSGFYYSYSYCDVIEHLAGIEVPKKAEYIRTMLLELNRVSSHLLWLGTYLLDLGATSPLFYTFRDREVLLSIFEKLTGQRMMYNYFTFGGVREDIDRSLLDEIDEFIKMMPAKIQDYENIISNNPIFRVRTENKGVITKNMVMDYAITGANARASGVFIDLRKFRKYLVYDELDFYVPILTKGDAYSRYNARISEMYTALTVAKYCVSKLKSMTGEVNVKSVKPMSLNLQGMYSTCTEGPRGDITCTVMADGKKPSRVKWRTGSYYAVQILPELLKGAEYSDLMAIFGSLDVILPEVDK